MKKLIYKLMIAGSVAMAMLFTACQEEFEEVGNDTQETLQADSSTVQLITNTASKDGSFDNIVDGASCIAVQFPYTVEVAGIQITIDSIEDLKLIEEIFDEFDDDEDVLEIIFPITITLADFTEVVIEGKEALRELASECREGGDDDDIECIDFVYPITLFTFDIDGQVASDFQINSDRELRRFFKDREEGELVSIEYPVTLKKYDGTEVQVSTNAELARVLDAAKDECDEDDDDDYNDDDCDDCTTDKLTDVLTSCNYWEISDFERNDNDLENQYEGYLLSFDADGGVSVKLNGDMVYAGSWEASGEGNDITMTLNIPELSDFNITWNLQEIDLDDEYQEIDFEVGDDNELELKSRCGDDDDGDDDSGDDGDNGIISIETLKNTLMECEWIIGDLELQGEDFDRLLGYEFIFSEDGVATLGDGITTFEGTWAVGANADGERTLSIEIMMENAVNLEWPVVDIMGDSIVETTRIKLEDDEIDYEMILQKVCDDGAGDEDVAEIRNIMLGGLWNVALYDDEGDDETDDYAGMDFGFSMFNQVEVSINDDPIAAGVWRAIRDTHGNLVFVLNLGMDDLLGELTEGWYVTEVSADRLELVYEDEEVNFKTLVFEKKQ